MKLFHLNSRYGIVNLISDLILTEINKNKNYKTIIQVTDCNNFYVINGITESQKILDLDTIREQLKSNFNDISDWSKNINFIDLIQYDKEVNRPSHLFINKLYYSERPLFSQDQINHFRNYTNFLYTEQNFDLYVSNKNSIDDTLAVTSSFPHGYSYSTGRDLLYYSEYIMYNIGGIKNLDEISIEYNINGLNIDFSFSGNSYVKSEQFKSMIKDYFDFDLTRFENSNYLKEITNPVSPKSWLIRDVKSEIVMF